MHDCQGLEAEADEQESPGDFEGPETILYETVMTGTCPSICQNPQNIRHKESTLM